MLELRSAELERRLEAVQEPARPVELAPAAPPPPDPEPEASARAALAAAVATVKELRIELDEQRQRVRRSELLRAADEVALATLRADQGRLAELERALADARSARDQAAEQVALAQQRAAHDAAAVRSVADAARRDLEDRLSAERTARAEAGERLAEARAARAEADAQLAAEQAAHAGARDQLAVREAELAAIGEELAGVRAELAAVRSDAAARADELQQRLAALELTLAAERAAHAVAATELETARSALAVAEAARRAESVARATLEEELDRERLVRITLADALDAARDDSEAALATAGTEAEQARGEASAAFGEASAARSQAQRLEIELAVARDALAAARARIETLEAEVAATAPAVPPPGDGDLARRAAEQAAAAAAAPAADHSGAQLAADLDTAAAALRARAAAPAAPPPGAVVASPPGTVPAASPPRAVAASPPGTVPAASAQRTYPWLRGALVRLAHDDPAAATRLLLGLVPAQRALITAPLEYDLCIRGHGLYAVSVTAEGAQVRPIELPRPRAVAAFCVTADVVCLAEVLAGVEKRMGRWVGSVRLRGRGRRARALRDALVRADLGLAAAARAGADLEPDLVFGAFAYAIDPAWTRGHRFTVAQEIADPEPARWHIAVRDGARVTVDRRPPPEPPDAVVSMSRATFAQLLRADPPANGERPQVRGDRAAVATLKAWTDRAQGR